MQQMTPLNQIPTDMKLNEQYLAGIELVLDSDKLLRKSRSYSAKEQQAFREAAANGSTRRWDWTGRTCRSGSRSCRQPCPVREARHCFGEVCGFRAFDVPGAHV
jgi:hypothetical protein